VTGKTPRRRSISGGVLLAVVVSLVAAAAGSCPTWAAEPRTQRTSDVGRSAAEVQDAEVAWHNAVVDHVADHPELFAGVVRDGRTGGFIVALPARNDRPGVRAALLAAAGRAVAQYGSVAARSAGHAEPVRFERSAQSRDQAEVALRNIAKAHAAHARGSAAVLQWWADPVTGRAVVGLSHNPSSTESTDLRAMFGSGLDIQRVLRGTTTSRNADSAPWYGGDRVTQSNDPAHFCSTGFGVRSGVGAYELSAGHCGSHTWNVGTRTLGVTPLREYFDGGLDAEAVTASSVAGRVWTGCATCSTSLAVRGRWDPVVGDQLCFDGSVTGLVCAATVTATNRCVAMDSGLTTCRLSIVSKADGVGVSQSGDSGGPVFWKTTTGVYAAATIVGFYGAHSSGLVQPLSWILPALGVSLVTG
jgi:hypothetical protein